MKKKKKFNLRDFVEKKINQSDSIVNLIASVVIVIICCLGFITLFSAFREVVIEARICLDEKFNMVNYTIGSDLAQENVDKELLKYHLENFEIGKYGFNVIIKIKENKVDNLYISDESIDKEELKKQLNTDEMNLNLRKSSMPFLFTKSGFDDVAPSFWMNGNLYKYRISKTAIDDIYVLSTSGQDEYILKILVIVFRAMVLTLIAVPILIWLVKKSMIIVKEQLDELENRIRSLETDVIETRRLDRQIHSKNEIGNIASAISELTKNLDSKANTDQLTGIKNKRYLNGYLADLEKSKDLKTVGIMLIDIDFFKQYNDTYGHLKGDETLKRVASRIEKLAGNKNLSARFGGEEFVVVVKNQTLKSFENLCREIVEGIKDEKILHEGSTIDKYLTISLGGAFSTLFNIDASKLVEEADNAVYDAKLSGRNTYIINSIDAKKRGKI